MNGTAGAGGGGFLGVAVVLAWNSLVTLRQWPSDLAIGGAEGAAVAGVLATVWSAWLDARRSDRAHRQRIELLEAQARLPVFNIGGERERTGEPS